MTRKRQVECQDSTHEKTMLITKTNLISPEADPMHMTNLRPGPYWQKKISWISVLNYSIVAFITPLIYFTTVRKLVYYSNFTAQFSG